MSVYILDISALHSFTWYKNNKKMNNEVIPMNEMEESKSFQLKHTCWTCLHLCWGKNEIKSSWSSKTLDFTWTHSHLLNSLLCLAFISLFHFMSDRSRPFPSLTSWETLKRSGRFSDLLLDIHTFYFYYWTTPTSLRQTHFALLWVQSKSKQTADCEWMCRNLKKKKQGKRHVLLHIVTLIFKE